MVHKVAILVLGIMRFFSYSLILAYASMYLYIHTDTDIYLNQTYIEFVRKEDKRFKLV